MEIITLLAALWRRKFIILGSMTLFISAGILLSVVVPRTFTSAALLEVSSSDSTSSLLNSLDMGEMAMTLSSGDEDMINKIYIALTPPVLNKVIWKTQLRNNSGFLYEPDDINNLSIISSLIGKPGFELTQESGTDVLIVKAVGRSKEEAMLMADTLADVYINHTTDKARAETHEAQTFVLAQLEQVKKELDEVYTERAKTQQLNAVIDMDWEIKLAAERLSQTLLEQQMLAAKIRETQGKIDSLRSYRRREIDSGGSANAMMSDPIIHDLRSKIWSMTRDRDALLANGYTEKAPEIMEFNASISASEKLLNDEMRILAALDPEIAMLEADMSGFQRKGLELAEQSDATTREFSSFPDRMREVTSLNLAAVAIETVYKSLADQKYQIGIAEAMTMSDTTVLSPGSMPKKHSSPLLLLNLIGGIFFGIAFGVATALLLDYVDDTIQDGDDLREVWPLPQLGQIYRYDAKDGIAVARLPATDPISEAYRTVRNGLEFASLDNPIKVLAITSAIPGEGKSTTAVNIAASIAKDNKRVLMIDGDLRLPTQHRQFPTTVAAPGLVDIIRRTHTPEAAIQSTDIDNLFLLAAGDLPTDPGHLIESERLKEVIKELAGRFDFVIIDAPPILAVNDAIILTRVVDAVALVIEARKVTRRMVTEVHKRFDAIGATPVGFILNKIDSSSGLYGAYAKHYQNAALARKIEPDVGGKA
jgi:capsular exopolysaccharide synthesis family protein